MSRTGPASVLPYLRHTTTVWIGFGRALAHQAVCTEAGNIKGAPAQPVQAQPEPDIVCEDCGAIVTEHGKFSATKIAETARAQVRTGALLGLSAVFGQRAHGGRKRAGKRGQRRNGCSCRSGKRG